jgi:hypothetical protein
MPAARRTKSFLIYIPLPLTACVFQGLSRLTQTFGSVKNITTNWHFLIHNNEWFLTYTGVFLGPTFVTN